MKTARLFIALTLPQATRSALAKTLPLRQLQTQGIRPIPEHDLHLTIRFLGDTDVAALPDCITVLKTIGERHRAFETDILKTLLLPPTRPRIIAAEVAKHPTLMELQRTLDDMLASEGIAERDHRKFTPHISIARVAGPLMPDDYETICTLRGFPIPCAFFDLVLFESTLRPLGPLYTPLATVPLA